MKQANAWRTIPFAPADMRVSARMLILSLLFAAFAACESADPPPEPLEVPLVAFETGIVRIETASDTVLISVEIAEADAQRRTGLMRRTSLAADSGMIFLFPSEQPAEAVFWMYNTLVPLSIAFISADGRIGSFRDMEPCPSPYPQYCPNYPSGVPFTSALEVNRGFFLERGIRVGDRVVLERR